MTVGPLCLVGVSLSRYRSSPTPKPGEALCPGHAWEKRKGKTGKGVCPVCPEGSQQGKEERARWGIWSAWRVDEEPLL